MEEASESLPVTTVQEEEDEVWTFVGKGGISTDGTFLLEDSDDFSDHGSDGSSIIIVNEIAEQVNNPVAVEEPTLSDTEVYDEGDENYSSLESYSHDISVVGDSSDLARNFVLKIDSWEDEFTQIKCENKVVLEESSSDEIDAQALEEANWKVLQEEKNPEITTKTDIEASEKVVPKISEEVAESDADISDEVHTEALKKVDAVILEEADILFPEEIDTEISKEVDGEVSKGFDPEVSEEVDVSDEVHAEAPEKVDAVILKEADIVFPKEVNTEISKEVDTKVSKGFDPEVSEEVDSDVSDEVHAEAPKKVNAVTLKEADIVFPEEVNTEISKEVDTEVSEEIDSDVSDEVHAEAPEKVNAVTLKEADMVFPEEVNTEISKEVDTEVSKGFDPEVSEEVDVSDEVYAEAPKKIDAVILKEADMVFPEEVNTDIYNEADPEVSEESITQIPEEDELQFPVVVSKLEDQISGTNFVEYLEQWKNIGGAPEEISHIQHEQDFSASHHGIHVKPEQVEPFIESEIDAHTVDFPQGLVEVQETSGHQISEELSAETNNENETSVESYSDGESLLEELMDDDSFENSNEKEMTDGSTTESESWSECSVRSSSPSNLEQSPTPLSNHENGVLHTKPDLLCEASHLEEELDQMDFLSISNPDLPAELDIANILRERHYVHHPNQRLNVQLTYFVAFVMAAVIGFAFGHIIGLSDNFPPRCPVSNESIQNPHQYQVERDVADLELETERLRLLNEELNRALKDVKTDCRFDILNELKSENLELKHMIGSMRYGKPARSAEDINTINRLQIENEELRTLILIESDAKTTNSTENSEQLADKPTIQNTMEELKDFLGKTTNVVDIIELQRKEMTNLAHRLAGDQMGKKLQSLTLQLLLLLRSIFMIDADEFSVQIIDKHRDQLADISNELELYRIKFQNQLKAKQEDGPISQKGLNSDWFLLMGRQREKIRHEERKTDWMFDRARNRENERKSKPFRSDCYQPDRRFSHYSL